MSITFTTYAIFLRSKWPYVHSNKQTLRICTFIFLHTVQFLLFLLTRVSHSAQEWTDHTRVILPRERGRHFGSCPFVKLRRARFKSSLQASIQNFFNALASKN